MSYQNELDDVEQDTLRQLLQSWAGGLYVSCFQVSPKNIRDKHMYDYEHLHACGVQ
jgi:hypothetical protein